MSGHIIPQEEHYRISKNDDQNNKIQEGNAEKDNSQDPPLPGILDLLGLKSHRAAIEYERNDKRQPAPQLPLVHGASLLQIDSRSLGTSLSGFFQASKEI
jgi:hypothetical protein